MHTTNYRNAFIAVAPDTRATAAVVPPAKEPPSVAAIQHRLLSERPGALTSDELLFEVHAIRAGIVDADRDDERTRFFSKGQPCLRSSPLGKTYGWGTLHDDEGRVTLVPLESEEYGRLLADPKLEHRAAMRSKRA